MNDPVILSGWNGLIENKSEAIKALFSLKLSDNDIAFIFLGYSGILLNSGKTAIAIDPGKSLTQSEISAIQHLDLLLFTHNHWDHYKNDLALQIIKQTGTHVVADMISSEELKADIAPNRITRASPGINFQIDGTEVAALPGIHAGPITQYLISLGRIKVFHGGDSGYLRLKRTSADLAFIPVGTATTCSPVVAIATIMDLQPKLAVPIHGRRQEMKQFKNIMEKVLPEVEVIVPDKFKPVRLTV